MKLTYNQYETIPILSQFGSTLSGNLQTITYNVAPGTSLSASVSGSVALQIFNGGTNVTAIGSLNGSSFPLSGIFMSAFGEASATSCNQAVYQITEGLTGSLAPYVTQYTAQAIYKLTDAFGHNITLIPATYDFYVQSQINSIDPR